MAIESINPATGKLLRSFEPLTDNAARQKIALAAESFRTYSLVPLEHRALWLRKLAAILEQEIEDLSTLITQEMGKPLHASRLEILKCADACRYYAEHAARILAPESIPTGDNYTYVRWDPIGVVLAVMPWNFPFWQVFRFLAPALMAGNVALLKHAANVPQCALAIESLVRRAGFPRGAFQSLILEINQVETVLGDEAGFEDVVDLELGGSDPFIVMPSADLDAAIETAVRARCVNSGQSCIAAKRFIIADEVYDIFESRFVAGMEAMRIGDPMKDGTDIGPLATVHAVELLEQQVQAATRVGARILTGGERMLGTGNYFEPTVLTSVPRTSAVYREELFGPVAMLFRVQDINEALEIANDTPFGLSASAWTREPTEQQRFISELQCGGVFINAMVASDPRLPFGGIKRSGYGRELSAAGMREFLNAKTVVISSTVSADEPINKPHLLSTAATS
jgi:succinate-semialdehyde dehydrogenase/glutarate-semialdehyde dehydrogenase